MQLLQVIHRLVSPADAQVVLTNLQHSIEKDHFKKGELVHQTGNVCHRLYYVEKGLVRASYLKEGKDISCYFADEGKFFTAIDSFFQRQSSQYNLEVLEDSSFFSLSYQKLDVLMGQFPAFERLYRSLMVQSYQELVDRLNMLQFYSSRERYENFTKHFPTLSQRLPLGHLASYLGMTQENLSRVRNPL